MVTETGRDDNAGECLHHSTRVCSIFKDLFYGLDHLAAEVCALYAQREERPHWVIGNRPGILNTMDSAVLMNKLTEIGSDVVKLQQPLQSSFLALGTNQWKLSKILPK